MAIAIIFGLCFTAFVFVGIYTLNLYFKKEKEEANSAPDRSLRLLDSHENVEEVEIKRLLSDLRKSTSGCSKAKRDEIYKNFYKKVGCLVARFVNYKVEMDEYDDLLPLYPILKKALEELQSDGKN